MKGTTTLQKWDSCVILDEFTRSASFRLDEKLEPTVLRMSQSMHVEDNIQQFLISNSLLGVAIGGLFPSTSPFPTYIIIF